MTGSPLDAELAGARPAEEARAGAVLRKPAARRWALLLFAAAAADVGLAFLGLNPLWGPQQLVTLAVLGLYAIGFAVAVRAIGAEGVARRIASLTAFAERHRRLAALPIGLGIVGALLAVWILRAFPNTVDEYAYLFGAKTFLAGRLWNPLPPLSTLFACTHTIFWHGKWVSGYTPGWSLLLAAVMGLRLPSWLAAPLCGGVLLFAVLKLGQKRDGAFGGVLATALVAISPFFLFNAGSYLNMVPATAAGLLFCWAALEFLDRPRWPNAISAGLALGVLGLIRSQDVLLFGLPFAAQFLWQARRRHYFVAPAIILAGLPFLVALLIYDHVVFGSLLPQTNLEYPTVRIGLFPVNDGGYYITPLHELGFVAESMVMLGNWTSPLFLFGGAVAFGVVAYWRQLDFLDFIFPTFVLGFMFVPFLGGGGYGPRYYFEGFPPLVLTVVSTLVPLLRKPSFSRWRTLAVSLLVAHGAACLAAIAVIVPFYRTVVDQKMDLYDQVQAEHLHNAVVAIASPTGTLSQLSKGLEMLPVYLTRNGISADGKVLYVLDIFNQLEQLHRLLPKRQFYVYERDPDDPKGSLRRLW
jgi:hypothetical protein